MAPIGFPDEGIENFVKLGLEHNPNMRFLVQISWGAFDQDMNKFGKGGFPGNVDRNKTPEQLMQLNADNIKTAEAQADAINKNVGKKVLFLVPSAQANVAARLKIINKDMPVLATQGELFADPISHPAAPLQALNTYLHFAALYRQSPVGLPMVSFLKNSKKYNVDKLNRALQELAWETIIKYPYSGVTGKPGDKAVVPAQSDKKDTTPPQPDKKDNPPAKKGIGGFPGGGFPGSGFPGKGAATPAIDVKTANGGVFANAAEFNKKCPVFYLHAGTAETAQHKGVLAFHGVLQKAGINSIFEDVQGTAHDWQTRRWALYDFAPRLFH